MAEDERSLATIEPADSLVRIARDHESRAAREMVFVDGSGRAVSTARATLPIAVLIGGSVPLAVVGLVPWAFPIVIGLMIAWLWPQTRRQLLGNALVLNGRFDEGERYIEPLARSLLARPINRGMARSTMAYIESCRGNHAAALGWAIMGSRRGWPRMSTSWCRIARVAALVNLDRVAEARAFFARHMQEVPPGDLLRHHHWQVELYIALAEGTHGLDADELHRRTREALQVTSGRTLLALLAWAHHAVGDTDQAWHVLRETLAREDVEVLERSRPRLHAWIAQHTEAALAAGAEDELPPVALGG